MLALVVPRVAVACDEELDDPEVCEEEVAALDESFDEDVSFFERLELDIGNRMMRGLVISWFDTFVVELEEEDDVEPADDLDLDFDADSDDLPDGLDDDFDDRVHDDIGNEQDDESEA